VTIEEYEHRFPPLLPPDDVVAAAHHLRTVCPITHSEIDDGFWVVNTYEECLEVLQDPGRFAVGTTDGRSPVKIPRDRPGLVRGLRPPIDVNPPLHRQFRNLINPWLSPQALAGHEPGFRSIIASLIDDFAGDGRCDIAGQLAKVFPAQLTFSELFGIRDGDELIRVRELVRSLTYDLYRKEPPELAGYQKELDAWVMDLVTARRSKDPVENLLDAVANGQIDGRPLTDEEVAGTVMILILGGFSTTADATCNLVIQLIEDPSMQDRLREEPTLIKPFLEEVLRLEPPITARARRATGDVELRGMPVGSQDRVLVNLFAANRDPQEFDHPDQFDLDRPRNRHLTFSAGVHRCVGSTMARMSLSIMLEELLARLGDIRLAPGQREERVSFSAGVWRAVDYLPVVFSPRS
jgi:cytochrome P450